MALPAQPSAAVQNLPVKSTNPGQGELIWRDPGDVSKLDFAAGPPVADGGPTAPFSFSEEIPGGTAPKLVVYDANRRMWEVKWGPEVKSEVFATRLLWAVGYFVEPAYFVRQGTIDNLGKLSRSEAKVHRGAGNSFTNARFELRDENALLVPTKGWSLVNNPFAGTNEFAGLKIMAMLVSNWDLKDPRAPDGANTSIIQVKLGENASEMRYIVNDWGASMGKWGGFFSRSKWDCSGYRSESDDFVKGVRNGRVKFGYEGKFTSDVAEGITVENVKWLMQYLGRITDDQLRAALVASGATPDEVSCFVPAVRARINALQRISSN
jgi:hypothetical protein